MFPFGQPLDEAPMIDDTVVESAILACDLAGVFPRPAAGSLLALRG
jgi:hypothetical protein